ncbi:hypothetical protein SAMN05661080_03571 [Modestobacter sp. DSM 44400]|uniref:hypothetical protein n=1 Tax=Modestobacter sp. DSM 44400 TaxID=1550230 RepID=UPI0008944E47|nr:hypothetical protein [Modestobacter sp. DSM 44400]SDY46752.1 hypothetical protein SAMN05661080_03571 [Modestobacter sp. DSM 44400]
MLFWPTVAVLGFTVLACLVIALGTSSTARYEFERNLLQAARQQVVVAPGTGHAPAGGGPVGPPADDHPRGTTRSGGAAAQERPNGRGAAVGLADHPAGKRVVEPGPAAAWWLVEELGEQSGEIMRGPFPDRIDADWAALSGGLSAVTRAVYGVQRADGAGLVRWQLPQERAWLSELGDQLDRLADDWDTLLSDEDSLTSLVVEVAAALVEAGLTLHDCTRDGPAGGVCLTPEAGHRGIVVSWHRHDRMSLQQARGAALDAAVQRTMNAALADLLTQLGFGIVPFGPSGCSLVPVTEQEA